MLAKLYSEAIPCFERALAVFEQVHGPTFPDLATVLRNMAFSWKRLGNMERMVEAWQRAERVDRGQTSLIEHRSASDAERLSAGETR
jgi:hypothetical protein